MESERRHPLATCEVCPLNTPETKFVPSQIPEGRTVLACVGEAPGFQEAAYRRPFTGPSGQLLKKVLRHQGYDLREVLFTNACLCRPPDNATPPKTAVAACRGRLYNEIDQAGVRDVIALGNT